MPPCPRTHSRDFLIIRNLDRVHLTQIHGHSILNIRRPSPGHVPSAANRELAVILRQNGHGQRDVFSAGGRESAAGKDRGLLLCPVACAARLLVVEGCGVPEGEEFVGGWAEGLLEMRALGFIR